MTLLRMCSCGNAHPEGAKCPVKERAHNAHPHRQAHRTPTYRRLRNYVLQRDHHLCQICHTAKATSVDFIVPLARGGQMTSDNAQAACIPCNSRKGTRTT